MIQSLANLFQFEFFQIALIASFAFGLVTPLLGSFVVVARQSVMSDMLSHTALAGVGFAALLGLNPSPVVIVSVVLSGLFLWLFQRSNHSPESISMVLLTGGLSFAIIFINLAPRSSINLENYLFGSILTISQSELIGILIVLALLLLALIIFWQPFLKLVFSPDYYENTSSSKKYTELMFILLVSLLVGISLKSIGGLLIGGLLVIPVLAAQNLVSNFKSTAIIASLLGILSTVGGLFISNFANLPTSPTIVILSISMLLLTQIKKSLNA